MKKMTCLLLAAAMLVSLAACQTTPPETSAADTTAAQETTQAPETTAEETTPAETEAPTEELTPAESLAARNAEAMAEYAPEVVTLDSGVQVQAIPSDPYLWNTAVLKADQRGCTACHTLEDAVQNLPLSHPELWNPYDVEMSVDFCYMCHSMALFVQDSIHAIHQIDNPAFEAMGGSCESCHHVNVSTGEYELWDRVKYNVMMGISKVANVEGEFSFTQDSITPIEELFFYWENGNHRGITPDYDENPDIYENWTITVTGLVDNELTLDLSDLAEEYSETRVMKLICQTNPAGGSYTANCEVTGIPLSVVLEKAGLQENANTVRVLSDDGWTYPLPVSYLNEEDPILVVQINGETIPAKTGYPVQLWTPNLAGVHFTKRVATIEVVETPSEVRRYVGFINPETGGFFNKPNATIFYIQNGQIFNLGEPITFEGVVDAYDEKVVAVEISMDKGATWTRYELGDTELSKWINWSFTYTPEAAGSYVIQVRGISETGLVSATPAQVMFNVK